MRNVNLDSIKIKTAFFHAEKLNHNDKDVLKVFLDFHWKTNDAFKLIFVYYNSIFLLLPIVFHASIVSFWHLRIKSFLRLPILFGWRKRLQFKLRMSVNRRTIWISRVMMIHIRIILVKTSFRWIKLSVIHWAYRFSERMLMLILLAESTIEIDSFAILTKRNWNSLRVIDSRKIFIGIRWRPMVLFWNIWRISISSLHEMLFMVNIFTS
jgi:hypothetical protein